MLVSGVLMAGNWGLYGSLSCKHGLSLSVVGPNHEQAGHERGNDPPGDYRGCGQVQWNVEETREWEGRNLSSL